MADELTGLVIDAGRTCWRVGLAGRGVISVIRTVFPGTVFTHQFLYLQAPPVRKLCIMCLYPYFAFSDRNKWLDLGVPLRA